LRIASPDEQATRIVLNKEYKENKMKDAKALAFIQQRVNKGILPRMQVHLLQKNEGKILQKQFRVCHKKISIMLQTYDEVSIAM
jgi:hypothetical protein